MPYLLTFLGGVTCGLLLFDSTEPPRAAYTPPQYVLSCPSEEPVLEFPEAEYSPRGRHFM